MKIVGAGCRCCCGTSGRWMHTSHASLEGGPDFVKLLTVSGSLLNEPGCSRTQTWKILCTHVQTARANAAKSLSISLSSKFMQTKFYPKRTSPETQQFAKLKFKIRPLLVPFQALISSGLKCTEVRMYIYIFLCSDHYLIASLLHWQVNTQTERGRGEEGGNVQFQHWFPGIYCRIPFSPCLSPKNMTSAVCIQSWDEEEKK